jgi:hypothetical protein
VQGLSNTKTAFRIVPGLSVTSYRPVAVSQIGYKEWRCNCYGSVMLLLWLYISVQQERCYVKPEISFECLHLSTAHHWYIKQQETLRTCKMPP